MEQPEGSIPQDSPEEPSLEELFVAHQQSPRNREMLDCLLSAAMPVIRNLAAYWIYARRWRPPNVDSESFLEDVVAVVSQKVLLKAQGLRDVSTAQAWLKRMVVRVIADMHNKECGRKHARRSYESLDEPGKDQDSVLASAGQSGDFARPDVQFENLEFRRKLHEVIVTHEDQDCMEKVQKHILLGHTYQRMSSGDEKGRSAEALRKVVSRNLVAIKHELEEKHGIDRRW
jgi:DNA-directed RNA polymerase specialized sigma24 family protein